jgi:fructose-1,6-bisphosphatase I
MPIINVSKLITLEHYIAQEEYKHPGATGEFTHLLHDLSFAIKIVSRDVRRAGLNDILGLANKENVHGEEVKKLDEFADEIIIKTMERSGRLCLLASEENENIILPQKKFGYGKYLVVFDPLDGSSNIDVNVTIGTIFSFYKRIDDNSNEPGNLQDVLQPGYKQVASGYALYGSSTVFVYTTGYGVNVFTYDPTVGEFLLTNENLKIPKRGKYYSTNEGYYNRWSPNLQKYFEYIKVQDPESMRPYMSRYIGTGVADIHRTLIYGGVYIYPEDSFMPQGKLRLVYEANPLAMLIEQAGGRATDGKNRILDIVPKELHERVPLYIGSEFNVLEVEQFINGTHPYLNQ